MELSNHCLIEVFDEILKHSEDPESGEITLRDFKKIVSEYDVEFIKGQKLTDEEFGE